MVVAQILSHQLQLKVMVKNKKYLNHCWTCKWSSLNQKMMKAEFWNLHKDKNEISNHSGEYSQDLLKNPWNLCPFPIVWPDSQCVEIQGHDEASTSYQCIGNLHFILFRCSTWSSDVGDSVGNLHCLVDIGDPELGLFNFQDKFTTFEQHNFPFLYQSLQENFRVRIATKT